MRKCGEAKSLQILGAGEHRAIKVTLNFHLLKTEAGNLISHQKNALVGKKAKEIIDCITTQRAKVRLQNKITSQRFKQPVEQ